MSQDVIYSTLCLVCAEERVNINMNDLENDVDRDDGVVTTDAVD